MQLLLFVCATLVFFSHPLKMIFQFTANLQLFSFRLRKGKYESYAKNRKRMLVCVFFFFYPLSFLFICLFLHSAACLSAMLLPRRCLPLADASLV